jgi:hypothetical protein
MHCSTLGNEACSVGWRLGVLLRDSGRLLGDDSRPILSRALCHGFRPVADSFHLDTSAVTTLGELSKGSSYVCTCGVFWRCGGSIRIRPNRLEVWVKRTRGRQSELTNPKTRPLRSSVSLSCYSVRHCCAAVLPSDFPNSAICGQSGPVSIAGQMSAQNT